MFCEAYESMLMRAYETSKEILSETEDFEEALAKLSLFMSINAGTAQLIATNTLKAFPTEEKNDENADKKA